MADCVMVDVPGSQPDNENKPTDIKDTPTAERKPVDLEVLNRYNLVLSNDKTVDYTRAFLLKTQWELEPIDQLISWLRAESPYPFDDVVKQLDWLINELERNTKVVEQLKVPGNSRLHA